MWEAVYILYSFSFFRQCSLFTKYRLEKCKIGKWSCCLTDHNSITFAQRATFTSLLLFINICPTAVIYLTVPGSSRLGKQLKLCADSRNQSHNIGIFITISYFRSLLLCRRQPQKWTWPSALCHRSMFKGVMLHERASRNTALSTRSGSAFMT